MTEVLAWEDYLTIVLYFAVVLAVGLWSTFTQNRGTTLGYFLAGRNMLWFPVGASVYSSNVGAIMFVGLAGTAAASGIAVTIYEWHAVFIIISLGWIFVPVYIASGSFTIPEYLKMRFGGKRIRVLTSVMLLGEIYCGVVFMQLILGWNIYISVCAILTVVAIYTVIGGLRAVIFTDTLQTFVMIAGAITVGGLEALEAKYMHAATNYTLANQSFYACGMPREDSFHIFRHPVTGDIPWTGSTFGLTVLALFVWCQDQLIVQRCLAAKNITHAKGGTLFAASLKFLSLPMFVLPGMVSRVLFTDEVACASPEHCESVCQSSTGCTNTAYPLLILRILPIGMRGLMLAALMAGMMSTLTSVFNSSSSIITLDLWTQFRKHASQSELMIVGRVTVFAMIIISILWLPILQAQQGGVLWFYLAAIVAYLAVPWCVAFILGISRMGMDLVATPPTCGSGEPDMRLDLSSKVDFLHFTIINTIICTIVMVIISLFTRARSEKQLRRLTWWTRHDIDDPELSDDETEPEDDNSPKDRHLEIETGLEPIELSVASRCTHAFYDWICGVNSNKSDGPSAEERTAIRARMTSIKESPRAKCLLNVGACVLMTAITFLFGYFA
ncbi:SC5AB-like protein [Mya arenaria]|uniref:SC5AB-like protein n=1 Tax=Mya arenaria TaxID=6604 RepID=A0ABY7DQL4_MYAAR|nr:SC5AB-like protein [Mya arenaria]